jgi:hypothetical protein
MHYRYAYLGENSALPQALSNVTLVIDSVDNYFYVIIEHALIYQFAGTNILETLPSCTFQTYIPSRMNVMFMDTEL